MAISREKKEKVVAELKELLAQSSAVVISDYRGLTGQQMAQLRRRLRPMNGKFIVAKNSLIVRSLQEAGHPTLEDMLQGPSALGLFFGDYAQPLREMTEFSREAEALRIKGGLLGDRVMSAEDVKTLSELPSVEVLRAQVLGSVQGPVSAIVGIFEGALRGVLYVLGARLGQLGEAAA